MCGPAGSGKSTGARGLERDGLVRMSFDDEAWRRGIGTMPLSDDEKDVIERDIKTRLILLVRAGQDVVLDFSFWSRQMRDAYRELLAPLGVTAETIYVNTPRDVALARVAARGFTDADDFKLPAELAAAYFDNFEVPTADEGPLTMISGGD
jgi:predicted kinase